MTLPRVSMRYIGCEVEEGPRLPFLLLLQLLLLLVLFAKVVAEVAVMIVKSDLICVRAVPGDGERSRTTGGAAATDAGAAGVCHVAGAWAALDGMCVSPSAEWKNGGFGYGLSFWCATC